MSIQRLIIAFLITIGLFSSTSGAAYSQGRMAGSQSITICSPDGAHDIMLGANGQPVPGEHECADCCFVVLEAQVNPELAGLSPSDLDRGVLPMIATSWLAKSKSAANARAPPVIV